MSDLPQKQRIIVQAAEWPMKETRTGQIKRINDEVNRANGIAVPALRAVENARRTISGGWDSRFEQIFEKALKGGGGGGAVSKWGYAIKQLQKEMHRDID